MHTFPSNPNFTYMDCQTTSDDSYFDEVVAVLDSVKFLFSKYFVSVDSLPLSVINNAPEMEGPEIIKETHTIYLTVDSVDENGEPYRYWNQFIFQFAHEFCHHMTFGCITQNMRWFEETICELASHFFLLKSAEQWSIAPPYPNWKKYTSRILRYELNRRKQIAYFNIKDLWDSNSNLLSSLQTDEYQRPINNFLAVKLLPYFVDQPSLWKIVRYMPQFQSEYIFIENIKYLQSLSNEPIYDILLKLSKF